MAIEYHRGAIADARAAFRFYSRLGSTLAGRFRLEFSDAIDRVDRQPHSWPKHTHGTRFCRFKSFPFRIVYLERAADILVLAVAHKSRHPNYWQRRTKN